MSSLYDIIDLASETGDRIIVHDRYGESDIALLPLREYRRLVRARNDVYTAVGDLSGDELIDKINRELSAWKAQQELDVEGERGGILADELGDFPPEDPFAEDFSHDPSWHKIGDVLRHEHDEGVPPQQEDLFREPVGKTIFGAAAPEVPSQIVSPTYSPIPLAPDTGESPLRFDDDEPVFYEEPV
jgi:hypothetical protein